MLTIAARTCYLHAASKTPTEPNLRIIHNGQRHRPRGVAWEGGNGSAEDREIETLHERMLKKQLWVIISKRTAPPEEMRKHLKAHLEHQISLEKQGIMYGAGPATVPGENEPAFGLIIIRASDGDEARRIADRDPMHSSGVRTYDSIDGR